MITSNEEPASGVLMRVLYYLSDHLHFVMLIVVRNFGQNQSE